MGSDGGVSGARCAARVAVRGRRRTDRLVDCRQRALTRRTHDHTLPRSVWPGQRCCQCGGLCANLDARLRGTTDVVVTFAGVVSPAVGWQEGPDRRKQFGAFTVLFDVQGRRGSLLANSHPGACRGALRL